MADINNTTAGIQLLGDRTADNIINTANSVTINTFEGDDTVTNSGERASIVSSGGRNVIDNSGNYSTIRTGMGDSTVLNSVTGRGTLIEVGWGDNLVENLGEYVTVQGGGRDDTLYNGADNVTAKGNGGDDFIHTGDAQNFVYEFDPAFDGHDTIYGFNETSTLKIVNITTATYRRVTVDNDIVIKFDNASITFLNAAGLANLNIQGGTDISSYPVSSNQNLTGTPGDDNLNNVNGSGIVIDALEGNDYVNNPYNEVTILGGADDDTINNNGKFNSISGGAGKDSIRDFMGDHNTIDGGDGDDIIEVWGEKNSVNGGGDNDSIYTSGYKSSIDGGAGDDTVDVSGEKVFALGGDGNDKINVTFNDATVIGGKDDDTIKIGDTGLLNPPQHTFIEYNDGDGDDVVEGFNETSTLKIGGTYSTIQSGNDIIFKVGAGSITLKDAANLTKLNIDGIEDSGTTTAPKINPHSVNDGKIFWGTPNKDNLHNIGNGQDVTIDALEDDDYISNYGLRASLNGRAGDDTIVNSNAWDYDDDNNLAYYTPDYSTLEGGDGNDSILNNAEHVTIDGGAGDDTIEIWMSREDPNRDYVAQPNGTFVDGGADNDSIVNGGATSVKIYGGTGDDTIDNTDEGGVNSTLVGGIGDDSINNGADGVSINGGSEDDYITNSGEKVTIYAGEDNDIVDNYASNVTINGGAGIDNINNMVANPNKRMTNVKIDGGDDDDVINSNGNSVTIDGGGGNDILRNFGGKIVVMNGGDGDDHLVNNVLTERVTINGGDGDDTVENYSDYVTISAGAGNDSIKNTGRANIDLGAGDDTVENDGAFGTITGTGNNVIKNLGEYYKINLGDGNDVITNDVSAMNMKIDAGNGNNRIVNAAVVVTIKTGAGNDYIKNTANCEVTITTGAGSDTIELGEDVYVVTVTDFGKGDEIWLPAQANSLTFNGYGIDVNCENAPVIEINGIDNIATVDYSWSIKNGVATYSKQTSAGAVLSNGGNKIIWSDSDKTEDLFTITGLKKGLTVNADGTIDGLAVNGNKITVSRNVLSTTEVSVDNGYELVLGEDVPIPYLKKESRSVFTMGNTQLFYYTSPYMTAGWQIDNGKIIYAPADNFETFNISGLLKDFDIEKISVNGYTITLPYEVLNGAKNVDLKTNFAYKLTLGKDCPIVTERKSYWKVNGTQATYYTNGKSDGFAVSPNGKQISYIAAVDGTSILSLRGLAQGVTEDNLDQNVSVNGKIIKVNANVVGKDFSVDKDYEVIFDADDYMGKNFVGTNAKDTVTNYGDNIKIGSSLGNDTITNYGAQVSIDGGHGNDSITTNGDGVTVRGGSNNDTITNHGNNASIDGGLLNDLIETDGDNVTVTGNSGDDTINNHGNQVSISGSAGKDIITTDGNGVTIKGGKGNDEITSGTTSGNVYQYAAGDGYDTIWGYSRNDTIQLTDVSSITAVNFNVPNGTKDIVITIGSGSITLKDAAKQSTALTFVDTDGKEIGSWRYLPIFSRGVFVNNNTGYITNAAKGDKFFTDSGGDLGNPDGDISNADSDDDSDVVIQHLDASLAKVAVQLIGDAGDNSLIGGSGSDTIQGGGGDDTFVGGAGNDLFIHDGGDVTIADYGTGSDKISLGSALDGFNINGTDLVLNSGTGSVTIKDAAGKKITFVENGKTSTQIFTYNGKTNSAGTAITLDSAIQSFAADSKLVTIDGSLTTNATIAGNSKANKIFGGDGDDMLIGRGGNDTLYGGAGSDIFIYDSGKNVILDFNGDEDKLVIGMGKVSSSSVNSKGDVVFKVGTGSVTVKKIDGEDISDGKTITVLDADGETTCTYYSEKIVSADGKVTLQSNFKGSSFTADENISEVDASAVTKKIAITGNDEDNSITGGKGANLIDGGNGNDLLFGGKGNDTFVVSEGNDTIADYLSGSNKISLGSAQIKNYSIDDGDVILYFEGGNSLTIQDAAGDKITLIENGQSVVNVYAEDGIFNNTTTKATAATLAADTQIFSAANYSKLTTIDGSAVTGEVEIVGNGNSNKIFAGDFNSTLNGGVGNDTLWGGNGSDTFIYNPGGGKDVIYGFGTEDQLQIGANFDAVLKKNSVVFKVGTISNAITLKDFSGTEFVANGDTYQLSGSKFVKK